MKITCRVIRKYPRESKILIDYMGNTMFLYLDVSLPPTLRESLKEGDKIIAESLRNRIMCYNKVP